MTLRMIPFAPASLRFCMALKYISIYESELTSMQSNAGEIEIWLCGSRMFVLLEAP